MSKRGAAPSQHAHADRGLDLYETPPVAVRALIGVEWVPNRIWEPACGPGAIMRELRATGRDVVGTDVHDYGGLQAFPADFLTVREAPFGTEAIVTNPPYRLAAEFAEHAIALCPRVLMLLRLNFLEAGTGPTDAARARASVLDGGKLARVLVFKERLPMMHRDGWEGPRNSSSQSFAWFVWDRSWKGPAHFHRVSWKEHADSVRQAAE